MGDYDLCSQAARLDPASGDAGPWLLDPRQLGAGARPLPRRGRVLRLLRGLGPRPALGSVQLDGGAGRGHAPAPAPAHRVVIVSTAASSLATCQG